MIGSMRIRRWHRRRGPHSILVIDQQKQQHAGDSIRRLPSAPVAPTEILHRPPFLTRVAQAWITFGYWLSEATWRERESHASDGKAGVVHETEVYLNGVHCATALGETRGIWAEQTQNTGWTDFSRVAILGLERNVLTCR